MNRSEAEKLLGGYATGTLTGDERRILFAAALDHQDLFDALADEEALRELLADPAVRAQLLAALAPAPPKVVSLWRHPGLLGAAASLMVASLAGLAYLRSPQPAPQAKPQEAAKAPSLPPLADPAKAKETTAAVPLAQAAPRRRMSPPVALAEAVAPEPAAPAPPGLAAGATVGEATKAKAEAAPEARMQLLELRRAEVQDNAAKKAGASRLPPASVVDVVAATAPAPRAARGKVAGGLAADAASAPAPVPGPAWRVAALPDGSTLVTVTAPGDAQVVLLKRGATGVAVVTLTPGQADPGATRQWFGRVHLEDHAVLDLYVLTSPAADPAGLPETGPVAGFRARIHPAGK